LPVVGKHTLTGCGIMSVYKKFNQVGGIVMNNISADDRLLFCDGMRRIYSQSQELTHRAVRHVPGKLESGGASHG
jgi:hypothetical protein